jgi:hypothetical protein
MIESKPSCSKCSRYLTCREPNKGPKFSCSNFKKSKELNVAREFNLLELMPPGESEAEEKRLKKSLNGRLGDYETSASDLLDRGSKRTSSQSRKLAKALSRVEDVSSLDEAPGDFIWKAMRDSYDPETNTVRDLKIDDRDLVRAENFYDFCINVSGKSIKPPFARQLWISYMLMGEYCPRCTKEKYVHDVMDIPVDADPADLKKRVTMLESGVCPKCGATKSSLILNNEMADINQLAMAAGQRAGKSSFVSTINTYLLHRFLKAPRLSQICNGIQDFTPLTFTFVGLTAGRAVRLLWNPFVEIVKASQWFRDYFSLMDHYGQKYGKELYKDQVLFYRFFTKNIDVYPMGPIKRTLRGDTRVVAAVDEIGWFPLSARHDDDEEGDEEDAREHANADEVYASLDNSLMTVRTEVYNLYQKGINHIPTGFMLNISSPQSEKDKIMSLVGESEDPAALSLGLQLATWDISPLYSRDHPVIVSAYKKNPIKAERDFGARPPSMSSSMFPDETILALFNQGLVNSHTIRVEAGLLEEDTDSIKRTSAFLVENPEYKKVALPPSILSVDAGLTNNSFTLVVAHLVDTRLVVSTLLEIIPQRGTQINFPGVYANVIKPLIKTMNVRVFVSDRWNSITTLQSAADDFKGQLECFQRTLNAKDFGAFRDSIENGMLEFPQLEKTVEEVKAVRNYKKELVDCPASHLFLQFLTTKQVAGVFVKGDKYTDDILRAVAVAHSAAFNQRVRTFLSKFQAIGTSVTPGVSRGAVFSRSKSC